MHVVTELFKKKKRVHSHFLSHRHRHVVAGISSRYILYFNAEKMPEKDNFILNTLSYVSDLKITSTDGRPEKKRQRTIRNIKFIRGNLYALLLKDHLNKINIFSVNTFKIMGNTFLDARLRV